MNEDNVKGVRRETIALNSRKMRVSNRSVFLLLNLNRQQAARRNVRRLKTKKG